jgi:hypothetical protein
LQMSRTLGALVAPRKHARFNAVILKHETLVKISGTGYMPNTAMNLAKNINLLARSILVMTYNVFDNLQAVSGAQKAFSKRK